MALVSKTGRGNFSRQSQYTLEVYIAQNSFNAKNNTSSMSYEIGVRKRSGTGYWSQYRTTWSATIFGQSMSGTFPKDSQGYYYDFRKYSYLKLKSGTITVSHNSNGSKFVSASAAVHANYGGGIGSANSSTSMSLRSIDRAVPTITSSVVSRGETSAVIRFTSNYPISDFQYQVSGGSWVKIGSLSGSKNVTVSGLTPNKSYNIRGWGKRSYNNVSGYGNYSYFSTEPVAPSRPTLSLVTASTGSITVKASASAGSNSPVKNYRFKSSHNGAWSGWSSSNTFTVTGLTPNTSYTIEVEASSGKTSPKGSLAVKTDTLPPQGGSISVNSIGERSIEISIVGLTSQAGIKNYSVYVDETLKTTSSSSSINISGLTPGKTVSIKVIATDTKGRTRTLYTTAKTKNIPISSSNIVVNKVTPAQKSVKIESSATAPSGVKSYSLEISSIGTLSPQTSGTFYKEGLSPFTTYSYKITVTDNEGNSASKSGSFKTTPKDPIIREFSLVDISPFEAKFFGSYLVDDKSSIHEVSIGDKKASLDAHGNATISGLTPNTEYIATLTVTNGVGQEGRTVQSIKIKTKEDKWAHISVNGAQFEKINIYVIYPNGETKKIEKSMMGIIGGK